MSFPDSFPELAEMQKQIFRYQDFAQKIQWVPMIEFPQTGSNMSSLPHVPSNIEIGEIFQKKKMGNIFVFAQNQFFERKG